MQHSGNASSRTPRCAASEQKCSIFAKFAVLSPAACSNWTTAARSEDMAAVYLWSSTLAIARAVYRPEALALCLLPYGRMETARKGVPEGLRGAVVLDPPRETPTRKRRSAKIADLIKRLGPGLVTGASDDDPSGIATYSQAGAHYGFGLLWTVVFSLPLMSAIQEISARIGRITGRGIAGNIRRNYPGWLLYPVIFLLVVANTINLGADIGAMGDALALLIGGHALLYAVGFALLCLALQVFSCYTTYSKFLKWLTPILLAYVATVFMVQVPWREAMKMTFVPHFQLSGEYWATFIAVLGTTISPYLFFWQASQETEELRSEPADQPLCTEPSTHRARFHFLRIRWDTWLGMTFSNLVAFFIMLTAAVTLHGRFGDVQ